MTDSSAQPASSLGSSVRTLSEEYDLAMLDLDGVVYRGSEAVPGAAFALAAARSVGMRLAYITNNASRPAGAVVARLREMGMPDVADGDVVTSAQAVAHLVADAVPPGSPVLLVGGEGLRLPLEERGLRCVTSLDDDPVAVVQGFHPDIAWPQLAEAAYGIQAGLPWYVSNTDMTVPTARGIAPGNGSLVQAVRNATGAEPVVAGKPERALFDETTERVGGRRPLMVGDRLDTDVDGAIAAGLDSLAVLTGVSSLAEIMAAEPGHRPSFVAADLAGLVESHAHVHLDGDRARCGTAQVEVTGTTIRSATGRAGSTELLRAAVALAWDARDRRGTRLLPDGTLEA